MKTQREIKFRAKRKDNGRWAYGHLVKTPITTEFNCDGQFLDSGGSGRWCIVQDGVAHEVDVNTVGQFTGHKDRIDNKIYEGDIVQWETMKWDEEKNDTSPLFLKAIVSFGEASVSCESGYVGGGFMGYFLAHGDGSQFMEDGGDSINFTSEELEVIDNVHDNPELLA